MAKCDVDNRFKLTLDTDYCWYCGRNFENCGLQKLVNDTKEFHICNHCKEYDETTAFVKLLPVNQYRIDLYAMACGFEDAVEMLGGDMSVLSLMQMKAYIWALGMEGSANTQLPKGATPIYPTVFHTDGGDIGEFYIDEKYRAFRTLNDEVYIHKSKIGG